ncbi:hypothetical protein ANN_11691 [Periplaneta americana]|uniref:Uncharacterized protein n=1 Tax=Periplaneta americana TaxID=6978 RepID=A0ABQ8T7J1_PERAM|nr:hypothetical protein ANN_11691 [Periplaneta americana]
MVTFATNISSTGFTKRTDIIAFDNNQKIGFIINPTIRFEDAELQLQEVDLEKKRHYEPRFTYLEEKYHIPVCRWEVIGLLFGARGTISRFCISFFHRFHIDLLELQDIAINVLSVAENGTTSYTRHISNLLTTVASLAAQTAAKVRYSHLTFPTLAFLRYSVQSVQRSARVRLVDNKSLTKIFLRNVVTEYYTVTMLQQYGFYSCRKLRIMSFNRILNIHHP